MSVADVEDITAQIGYQDRLRAIGRHLDDQCFRRATILDVASGTVAHGVRRASLQQEGVVFSEAQLQQSIEEGEAERGHGASYGWRTDLLPTGYEDFLRAIGWELDRHVAREVVISELFTFVTVSGLMPDYTPTGHTTFQPFEWVLSAEDIRRLLDRAFRRRRHVGFIDRRRRARLMALKRAD